MACSLCCARWYKATLLQRQEGCSRGKLQFEREREREREGERGKERERERERGREGGREDRVDYNIVYRCSMVDPLGEAQIWHTVMHEVFVSCLLN